MSTGAMREHQEAEELRRKIIEALKGVKDPETSLDVWSMRLVKDLRVGKDGKVSLTFRPSSVVCPLGFSLGANIKKAVESVHGVHDVHVKVEDFVYAEQLNRLLNQMDQRR